MEVVVVPNSDETGIVVFDAEKAEEELRKHYSIAEETLKNEDAIERLLQRLEKKLKGIGGPVGEKLSMIPTWVSLVRSYVKKEYTDIPIGSVVAIVSAIIYFVAPVDFIPDGIPVAGHADDVAVVVACWKLVESDVIEYQAWREKNFRYLKR